MPKPHNINIYDDENSEINILDSGVIFIDDETNDKLIDMAIEISYRVSIGSDYQKFVDRLMEICKDNEII